MRSLTLTSSITSALSALTLPALPSATSVAVVMSSTVSSYS